MEPAPANPINRRPRSVLVPREGGREREVLEAAAEVFARRGYAAATVQDVADTLGILKGSLYYYIKTKEDLLYRIMIELHENADALHADVASTELSPLGQLLLYVRLQIQWNVKNLVQVSVYYSDMRQLSAERLADVRERARAHERFIRELIARGQADGEILSNVDAALLAHYVLAIVIWPHRWFRSGSGVSIERLLESCEEFVRSGLNATTG